MLQNVLCYDSTTEKLNLQFTHFVKETGLPEVSPTYNLKRTLVMIDNNYSRVIFVAVDLILF